MKMRKILTFSIIGSLAVTTLFAGDVSGRVKYVGKAP